MENTNFYSDFTKSTKEYLQKKTDEELINSFNRECGGRGWTTTRSIYLEELRIEIKKRKWYTSDITNFTDGFNLADGKQIFLEDNKLHLLNPKPNVDFVPVNWQEQEEVDFEYEEKLPKSAEFVTGAEWTFNAMNARFSKYFISSNKTLSHWILWHQISKNRDFEASETSIAAWCIRTNEMPIEAAAKGLLKATWQWEINNNSYWDENFTIEVGLLRKRIISTIKFQLIGFI